MVETGVLQGHMVWSTPVPFIFMYTLKVQGEFSSAHRLRGYKGKCEGLHGHNWHVELAVSSRDVNNLGMVIDFNKLKAILKKIMSGLDHKYLNDLNYFKKINPTSENIARYIYDKVFQASPKLDIKEVTVWETDSSQAVYSRV